MHNTIPLTVAALIAVGIIVIGCFYLVSPERIVGTFGLKPPASDADTRAWLRPKGIRDVVAGLVVLTMMLTADTRMVGIALLVEAVNGIPKRPRSARKLRIQLCSRFAVVRYLRTAV